MPTLEQVLPRIETAAHVARNVPIMAAASAEWLFHQIGESTSKGAISPTAYGLLAYATIEEAFHSAGIDAPVFEGYRRAISKGVLFGAAMAFASDIACKVPAETQMNVGPINAHPAYCLMALLGAMYFMNDMELRDDHKNYLAMVIATGTSLMFSYLTNNDGGLCDPKLSLLLPAYLGADAAAKIIHKKMSRREESKAKKS
jgi:hypothetical protein